jgi:hypothetical protein
LSKLGRIFIKCRSLRRARAAQIAIVWHKSAGSPQAK